MMWQADDDAERIGTGRKRASYHVSEIISKLGVSNRHEAAAWPKRPPWWTTGLAPVSRWWRKMGAAVPMKLGSVATVLVGASILAALGALGLVAVLLLRTGDSRSVPFETIGPVSPGYSALAGDPLELYVVRDAGEWRSVWTTFTLGMNSAPPLPPVNFEEEMVLGLFGAHDIGGYSIIIDRVLAGSDEWVVEATHHYPCPACASSPLGRYPNHIVRLERTDLPVRLSLTEDVWGGPSFGSLP
jgi:hypothetical protein